MCTILENVTAPLLSEKKKKNELQVLKRALTLCKNMYTCRHMPRKQFKRTVLVHECAFFFRFSYNFILVLQKHIIIVKKTKYKAL